MSDIQTPDGRFDPVNVSSDNENANLRPGPTVVAARILPTTNP